MAIDTPERGESPGPPSPVGAFEPFRHRLFAACWWGSFVAQVAVWLQNVTVPYLVYEMTGSATWLGVAAVAGQAPALIASPLGGVLADRYSRKGLMLATLALKLSVSLSFYALWSREALGLGPLLALLVLSAASHTVHLAVSSAFIPQTVPRRSLGAAVRLNSLQVNIPRALGPAIGGYLLANYGADVSFIASAVGYLPFGVVLVLARVAPIPAAPRQSTWDALMTGMRTISESRAIAVPVLTAGVVSIFGSGIQPLVAGLATDVYEVGPEGYGWLVSMMGISSAAAGLLLAAINERMRRSTLVWAGFLFYGVGAVLAGATTSYPLALACFALLGVGHSFVYICCATAIQLRLSEEVRGRVTALHMTVIFVGMPFGAQVGGFLGDLVGMPAVLIAYGAIMGAFALTSRFTMRGFRDMDEEDEAI